jgi:hypothetical protein
MRALALSSLLLAAASPCLAADLSAPDISRMLGVQISKVTTERHKVDARSTDTTYLASNGDPVLILHRGHISLWPSTRDAVASMSKPFPGISQAYQIDQLGMICAPGAREFVCVTPSVHFLMTKTKPSDDSLVSIIKAAL